MEIDEKTLEILDNLKIKDIILYLRDIKKLDDEDMCDLIDEFWLNDDNYYCTIVKKKFH